MPGLLLYNTWAVFTIFILFLKKKYPLTYKSRFPGWGIHIGFSILLALIHILAIVTVYWAFRFYAVTAYSFTDHFIEQLLSWLHLEIIVYWAILSLAYVFDFYRDQRLDKEKAADLNTAADSTKPYLNRLAVKNRDETIFVNTAQIDWIEAADNYVQVHTNRKTYLLRNNMNTLEMRLNPRQFQRVHRSAIVNIDRIKKFERSANRRYKIILHDGTAIDISRRRQKVVQELIKLHHPS